MTIYVSSTAEMTGDGSRERPFLTIQEAAEAANPGDTVLVGDGIYREHVRPVRSGTREHPISFIAANPGHVTVSGAETVSRWEPAEEAGVYICRIGDGIFGGYNPFTTLLAGDWIQMEEPLHTAMVFLDDKPMQEVADPAKLTATQEYPQSFENELPSGTWHTEQQGGMTVIRAHFGGKDPKDHCVEITVRRNCFMPAENGINYITVSGFSFVKTATQWAPPTAYQDGAVGPHWALGWVIDSCEIAWSRCVGISLGKYLQEENENKWTTRHVKHGTQTERDAVCQAVNDGWSRETVGSHIVRECDIHDCGQAGIAGHLGGAFSLIENNHIHHINNRRDIGGAEIAGIKLHAAIDTVIAHNHIHHATRGLWLDWQAQGTRVTGNLFHDNMPYGAHVSDPAFGEDLFIEVSHGPTLVDNNLLLSVHAARLATQGIALVHNLIMGSFTSVGTGTDNKGSRFSTERYTPYHVPHSTKIAGFMTILHGDARFLNNIFVQNVTPGQDLIAGTQPYEGYPSPEDYFARFGENEQMFTDRDRFYDHLPVICEGNAYFNGAQPCSLDRNAFEEKENRVTVSLKETGEGLKLLTDLYRYLPGSLCGTVSTETLGKAFESEQRFEAPDGTQIILNEDYRGKHRGAFPMCGPVETEDKNWNEILLTRKCGIRSRVDIPVPDAGLVRNELHQAVERFADKLGGRPETRPEVQEETPRDVGANLVLLHCEECTFPQGGSSYTVKEMYIRGNEVWMTSEENPGEAIHLDCEYGYFKRIEDLKIRTAFAVDVSEDRNLLGIVNTVATMYRILSRSMVQDPQAVCERIRDKANEALMLAGITMRFTPQLLKFIRNRRFITLEEVIDTIAEHEEELVAEVVDEGAVNG